MDIKKTILLLLCILLITPASEASMVSSNIHVKYRPGIKILADTKFFFFSYLPGKSMAQEEVSPELKTKINFILVITKEAL